jgi:hypothetical protein
MWKEIRAYNLGAIILVAAAIIAGGTDVVPPTMSEPIADFFREAFLLLSGCVAWAVRALADVRLILFGMLGLLLLFYVLTRPQSGNP